MAFAARAGLFFATIVDLLFRFGEGVCDEIVAAADR